MRIIRNKRIRGKVLDVDGKHFVGCTLTGCVLQYSGGHVVMEGTRISGCHHVFVGPARLTINYLEAMELVSPHPLSTSLSDEIIH